MERGKAKAVSDEVSKIEFLSSSESLFLEVLFESTHYDIQRTRGLQTMLNLSRSRQVEMELQKETVSLKSERHYEDDFKDKS